MAASGQSRYASVCAPSKLEVPKAASKADLRTTGRSWHRRQTNHAIRMHVPVRRRKLASLQAPAGDNSPHNSSVETEDIAKTHNSSVQEDIAKTQENRDIERRVEHNKRRVVKTMIERVVRPVIERVVTFLHYSGVPIPITSLVSPKVSPDTYTPGFGMHVCQIFTFLKAKAHDENLAAKAAPPYFEVCAPPYFEV